MTQTAAAQQDLNLVQRLLANTTPNGDCLEWNGTRNAQGYGKARAYPSGPSTNAHRILYQALHGVVLGRFEYVCHSCDNPPCINPAHLWVGSPSENMADMTIKGRGGRATLTPEHARDIKSRYFVSGRGRHAKGNARTLADEYGVSIDTIYFIAGRHTWTAA